MFDRITRLDAYYPTRTERLLVERQHSEIASAIGSGRTVFEYGSGSSEKIKQLLGLMIGPRGYVAMDISREHLLENASALARDSNLSVGAICADFNTEIHIPETDLTRDASWLGFFPGSTIGNFSQDAAVRFLNNAASTLGQDAKFLIGFDLQKSDPQILHRAYDDPEGVTAAFNLNLLHRMVRDLGAEIEIDAFEHEVRIKEHPQRMEMHLVARRDTTISLDANAFHFSAGDSLHTENSFKYTPEEIDALAAQTPWRREAMWTDPAGLFAMCLFSDS